MDSGQSGDDAQNEEWQFGHLREGQMEKRRRGEKGGQHELCPKFLIVSG